MKTVAVQFPPSNQSHTLEEAISIRNHRVDAMLQQALTTGRIVLSDIDEYNNLYHRLVESENATERAEILKRMSEIDGSADASANASTLGDGGDGSTLDSVDTDLTTPLDTSEQPKYFRA